MGFSASVSLQATGTTGYNVMFTLDEGTATGYEVTNKSSNNFTATITNSGTTSCTIQIVMGPTNNTIKKIYTFDLIVYGSKTDYYTYKFSQQANKNYYFQPICHDINLEFDDLDVLSYDIYRNDETLPIYAGKVNKLPNNDKLILNCNRICSNYLDGELSEGITDGVYYLNDYADSFKFKSGTEDIAFFYFRNDYSYKNNTKFLINDPIKRRVDTFRYTIDVDRRCKAIFSMYAGIETTRDDRKSLYITGNNQYVGGPTDLLVVIQSLNDNTIYGTASDNSEIAYRPIDTNYDYCLYYKNAFGGYDVLMVGGNAVRSENYDSKYISRNYDNTKQDFEKKKYANIITENWVLYTDWFSDDEQSRLYHLLGSTEVYLHNLNTDEILPVNITNSRQDFKTFQSNGAKKFYNTINVQVAREKIRR